MKKMNMKKSLTGIAIGISLISAVPVFAMGNTHKLSSDVLAASNTKANTSNLQTLSAIKPLDTKSYSTIAAETEMVSSLPVRLNTESENPTSTSLVAASPVKAETTATTAATTAATATASSAKQKETPKKIEKAAAVVKPAATVKPKAQTKQAPEASSASGNVVSSAGENLNFDRVLSLKATAYSDAPEENGWGSVDYFGNPLKLGTVAVDSSVIPLGSTLYITGYSFNGLPGKGMIAKATDMGSAIKGNRIDIFIPGSAAKVSEFGFQNVKVYILK